MAEKGKFDAGAFVAQAQDRKTRGVADFEHDADVKSGKKSGVHQDLNPKWTAGPTSPLAGQNVRECRDSDAHPKSLPFLVFFDVTGSMGEIPKRLQKKLPNLMETLIVKAGVKHPQILAGAIGDMHTRNGSLEYGDQYPFQVSQFEADNRIDSQLRSIILEGGGGGQKMECYGYAYRFAAYHTATDSFEKRGKKGYLITIGDEAFWPKVTKEEVSRIFGVSAETDETVEDLYAKASEKWDIYHIHCMEGSYPDDMEVLGPWQNLLGERFIKLADADLVCEVIAGLVQMFETGSDLDTVVKNTGLRGRAGDALKKALVPVSAGRVPAHVAKGNAPNATKKSGGVSRV